MGKDYSRRDFLKLAVSASAAVALTELSLDVGALARGKEINYPVTNIPTSNLSEPVWVVQITDLHVGGTGIDGVDSAVCKEVANTTVTKLQEIGAKPNKTILTFTGDGVIGNDVSSTTLDMFRESMSYFDAIPAQMRLAVAGNHDFYYEQQHGSDLHREYERLGYEVMGWKDEDRLVIDSSSVPIQIVGTPDYTTSSEWYKRSSSHESLFSKIDKAEPLIWLTHNASVFDVLGWGRVLGEYGYNITALSGHTHGGQVDGNSILQSLGKDYALKSINYDSDFVSGIYSCSGDVRVNVCNGLGSSTRVRTTDRQVGILELVPA